MSKKTNLKGMARGSNVALQSLKREQIYTRQYTPYMLALFCLTLKRNTDLSNGDIEHLIDCFQEEAEKSQGMNFTFEECKNECGLMLYAEPDKARVSK